MYQIAIVEDEPEARDVLQAHVARYAKERELVLECSWFPSALSFEEAHQSFDLVFLDIQLPGIDGMELARLLRSYDEQTPLVFVTNLAELAVHGYQVNALDFMVKPVGYFDFRMRMDKALRHLRRNAQRKMMVNLGDEVRIIAHSDIEYVEVRNHSLSFHLVGDESLQSYGSLGKVERELEGGPFVRISSSALVNMNHIRSVRGPNVTLLGGDSLPLSRSRKKAALEAITSFLGGSL